jgi:hypothetical protein
MRPRSIQSVQLVLSRVVEGKHVVLIDRLESSQDLADAIIEEAEKRGIAIKVSLIDEGVSVELDTPTD